MTPQHVLNNIQLTRRTIMRKLATGSHRLSMRVVIYPTCQITELEMRGLNLDMLLRCPLNSTGAPWVNLLIHLFIKIITIMEFMEGKAQTMHSYTIRRFMHRAPSITVIILF
jgi:hypothetical protein